MTGDGDVDLAKARRGGLSRLRVFTPARIALGRVGSATPTAVNLQFLLDHARARDAVHAALAFPEIAEAMAVRGWPAICVRSAARDRAEYLRRPDLGRRLSPEGKRALSLSPVDCDVAIVAADGLSAAAIAVNLLPLLDQLAPALRDLSFSIGPIALAEQGRVAIGDEIGEALNAKLAIVLIGERPGLSAADSLGCYITWRPRIGTMDSGRHCISNIRAGGLSASAAAGAIVRLAQDAFAFQATGVELDRLRRALPAASAAEGE